MKKILTCFIIIVAMLISFCTADAAQKKEQQGTLSLTYETKDGFIIKSKLIYPKVKKEKYPLVILLHSLGYSSSYWGELPKLLNEKGYAVIAIDLRGHGDSSYDSNFRIHSWLKYTEKNYSVYPSDIAEVLNYVLYSYVNISRSDYAIIGADIGANTAILSAEKLNIKPRAMVFLSASRNFKGLYTPIALANLGSIPILAIASKGDNYSCRELMELKKFAQGTFEEKIYPIGGMGIMMLKVNSSMGTDIANWLVEKLK